MADTVAVAVETDKDLAPLTPAAGVRLSAGHAVYVTALLALITMLSVADGSILSVLLVPMQKDLHVSDAAMGALTGISFTLVYTALVLPAARLADTGKRRNIIAGALAVWSFMTAVCGVAGNYATLLVARMGVAAAQASSGPASMSFIGDLFSFKRRGTALGFITLGSALGTGLGAVIAGQLSARYNWHVAFMALGAPGLLVAILFVLTVPEPERGAHDGGDVRDAKLQSWRSSIRYLFSIPSFIPLVIGNMFLGVAFAAFISWMPAYLMRVQGLPMGQMSALWGVVTAPAIIGVVVGGYVSDRLATRGPRWRVYFMSLLMLLGIPIFCTLLLTNDMKVVSAMMLLYALVVGPVASIVSATSMDVVRPRARGIMAAVIGICASVMGAGLGPLLIGVINDVVKRSYGQQSLRVSLITLPICMAIGMAAFLWASRTTDRDAAAARNAPLQEPAV